MKLIDTHCHLAGGKLQPDAAAVLRRAGKAGVSAVICAAADLQESKAALALARKFENVYSLAGVHPHEAKGVPQTYLEQIERLCEDDFCVAVGEIGLDYHHDFSPREDQRRVFAEQLALARRLGAMAVIHAREAFDDTLDILAESGLDGGRVVFHSFTGGPAEARRILDAGSAISFSGIATFKRADDIREAAALVPPGRILIETDSPYLSPEPVRKMKINEPANLPHVCRRLAETRATEPQNFADQTTANAIRLFGLKPNISPQKH